MIDKLYKPFPFRINSVGVNPSDVPTILELLNDYYNKINDTIDLSNTNAETVEKLNIDIKDFMEWVTSTGIKETTLDVLNVWVSDGTLEVLINSTLFNDKINIEVVNELPVETVPNTFYMKVLKRIDDNSPITSGLMGLKVVE